MKTKFRESKHKENTIASYPALRLTQNQHIFYFTTIPVDDIFPYCYVARRDEDQVRGFQRVLNFERAMDIADYLDGSDGSIPTNIVLSAQEDADFRYMSTTKTIKYKRLPNTFLVLDGQHRIYGYGMTKKDHRVPVAIYQGLDRRTEARLFIDINTTQRGVPAALLLDIKQLAERETESEATYRYFFDRLSKDPDSPLCGLLSPSKSATGKISRVTFNKGMSSLLKTVVMQKLSQESKYSLIRNYLSVLNSILGNPRLIRKAAYFEAFCELFDEVARVSRSKHGDYKKSSLESVLAPLANFDLEAVATGGKSKVTSGTILICLKQVISESLVVSEDMV